MMHIELRKYPITFNACCKTGQKICKIRTNKCYIFRQYACIVYSTYVDN
jgi:hypothetical protein